MTLANPPHEILRERILALENQVSELRSLVAILRGEMRMFIWFSLALWLAASVIVGLLLERLP